MLKPLSALTGAAASMMLGGDAPADATDLSLLARKMTADAAGHGRSASRHFRAADAARYLVFFS